MGIKGKRLEKGRWELNWRCSYAFKSLHQRFKSPKNHQYQSSQRKGVENQDALWKDWEEAIWETNCYWLPLKLCVWIEAADPNSLWKRKIMDDANWSNVSNRGRYWSEACVPFIGADGRAQKRLGWAVGISRCRKQKTLWSFYSIKSLRRIHTSRRKEI